MDEDVKTQAGAVVVESQTATVDYPCTPIEEIPQIVSELRENFESKKPLSLEWRVHQLKSLFKLFKDNEDKFAAAIHEHYGAHLKSAPVRWMHIWGCLQGNSRSIR